MAELERHDWTEELLVRAATTVDYPATPDIAGAVRRRLAAGGHVPAKRAGLPRWAPGVALAAAAGVAGFAVALGASREAREAVADFLGLSVEGEEIDVLPTAAPGETPTPLPTARPIESYATPVGRGALGAAAGFEPAYPEGAGEPLEVYLVDFAGARIPVLQYERFDLWEARLGPGQTFGKGVGFFDKLVFGQGNETLSLVEVSGQPAYWISNGSHVVRFVEGGTVVAGSERTVERNTLVWQAASGINYRMETDLSLEEALAIAETLP
jgi:hypothetical protein